MEDLKLYNLSEIYNNLMDLEIDDEDLQIALKNIKDAIEVKAESMGGILREISLDIEKIKNEEERLYKMRKSLENREKSIKSYLQSEMEKMNLRKIRTPLFSFNIQKNAPSLKIIDESKIPEDYFKIERKLIKSDVKEAVKNGLLTDAAELVSTESLRMR